MKTTFALKSVIAAFFIALAFGSGDSKESSQPKRVPTVYNSNEEFGYQLGSILNGEQYIGTLEDCVKWWGVPDKFEIIDANTGVVGARWNKLIVKDKLYPKNGVDITFRTEVTLSDIEEHFNEIKANGYKCKRCKVRDKSQAGSIYMYR